MDLLERSSSMTQRHPWELCRYEFFSNILADAHILSFPVEILDIGSGDGWFAQSLLGRAKPGSRIVCWDSGYSEQSNFEQPSIPSKGIEFVSRPSMERFKAILLLDVLEHVEDDEPFLRKITSAHLVNDGYLLISVPAWQHLFSNHDIKLHHYRRYAPSQARALIQSAGLAIVREGGLFHSLLIPRSLQVLFAATGFRQVAQRDLGQWQHGPKLSAAILNFLRVDTWISRQCSAVGLSLPGLSWWALCRKA